MTYQRVIWSLFMVYVEDRSRAAEIRGGTRT